MKTTPTRNLLATTLACALALTTAQAQQVPLPTTAVEVPGPPAGTTMTKEYVQMVGRIWGYALVNSHNRRVLGDNYICAPHM